MTFCLCGDLIDMASREKCLQNNLAPRCSVCLSIYLGVSDDKIKPKSVVQSSIQKVRRKRIQPIVKSVEEIIEISSRQCGLILDHTNGVVNRCQDKALADELFCLSHRHFLKLAA